MLQKRTLNKTVYLFFFCALLIANAPVFLLHIWLITEVVYFLTVLWIFLALSSVGYLLSKKPHYSISGIVREYWFFVPFVLFSGISIFWSMYWGISLSKWMILISTIIVGWLVGTNLSLKQIIRFVSYFGLFILISSTILATFGMKIGVMNYYSIQGAWKGIYWHKNHLGAVAALVNLFFLVNIIYSFQSKEKGKILWSLLYIFSLAVLLQTDSVGGYITVISFHGVIAFFLLWQKVHKQLSSVHYFIVLLLFGVIVFLLFANLDFIFGLFNRNTTLTGRIPLWGFLFDSYISKKPFVGYGFNTFWYNGSYQVELQKAAKYPGPILIADNGFIDILLNTGFIGFGTFILFYVGLWWKSVIYAKYAKDIFEVFPLFFMVYTLIANMSWSILFENENFIMLIMITLLFSISKKFDKNDVVVKNIN